MSSSATKLHGATWQAEPNGTKPHALPYQTRQPLLSRLFSERFELPEWGRFRMTDSGRFSMPYAMLAIMVTLCCAVIAALVTVGIAFAGGALWMVMTLTEMKTTVNQMAKVQQTQESKIDGLKAYVNVQTREADTVKN